MFVEFLQLTMGGRIESCLLHYSKGPLSKNEKKGTSDATQDFPSFGGRLASY